jgi:hypothetical protein
VRGEVLVEDDLDTLRCVLPDGLGVCAAYVYGDVSQSHRLFRGPWEARPAGALTRRQRAKG